MLINTHYGTFELNGILIFNTACRVEKPIGVKIDYANGKSVFLRDAPLEEIQKRIDEIQNGDR